LTESFADRLLLLLNTGWFIFSLCTIGHFLLLWAAAELSYNLCDKWAHRKWPAAVVEPLWSHLSKVSIEWQFITLQILSEYFLVAFDRYHQ